MAVLDVAAVDGNPYATSNLVRVVYPSSAAAIRERTADIALPSSLPFVESLAVSVTAENAAADEESAPAIANDDVRREELFYSIALRGALEARSKLRKAKIPFSRPSDYFAEMVKGEKLMDRARNLILQKQQEREAAVKARKQRELKKMGKKVQHEKILQRQRQKKVELNKIELLKKKKRSRNE